MNIRLLFGAAITLVSGMVYAQALDEAAGPLEWRKAFSMISGPDESHTLVVMLITNDPAVEPLEGEDNKPNVASAWCREEVEDAVRETLDQRLDLRNRLVIEHLPIGLPPSLTGGQSGGRPARAMLAVCDAEYRLLGLAGGVPEPDHLVTLIEDAEEVLSIGGLEKPKWLELFPVITKRSSERVSRGWKMVLDEQANWLGAEPDQEDPDRAKDQWGDDFRHIAAAFQQAYLKDCAARFGLSDQADVTRLIILEQHPQTRHAWCEVMLPFWVGKDFKGSLPMLMEAAWGTPAVLPNQKATELVRWWDGLDEEESVGITIAPGFWAKNQSEGPDKEPAQNTAQETAWECLAERIEHGPHRQATVNELVVFLREKDINPIDLQGTGNARYLFFITKKESPMVIRHGNLSARQLGLVKRIRSMGFPESSPVAP